MVCHTCGQNLRDEIRFCPHCGTDQQAAPKPVAPPPSPEPREVSVRKGISTKTILIIALAGFVLIAGIVLAAWFFFFPPGVYVRDSFRKAHNELARSLQGVNASFNDGFALLRPPNQKFYVLLYETPTSNKATIETTVLWKEGDENAIFGIVCCGSNEDNFIALMVGGRGDYLLNTFAQGEWYDLTGFLRLPKTMKIQKDVPYRLKLVLEEDYLSAYLDDTLLIRLLDAYQHSGRPGIYAQGGKSGNTLIAFDDFKAKKNSLFQKDN